MEHDRIQLWLDGEYVCRNLYIEFDTALACATWPDQWRAFALQGGNTLVAVRPRDTSITALFTYDYVQAEEKVVVTGRFVLDERNIPLKWERIAQ